jgi:predicted alpha/beta hydrolase family esterase
MFLFYHENGRIIFMKNALILHGSSCTPDSFWYPYLKKELERRGYRVWAPQLPKPEAPNLKIQLPFIMRKALFTKETVLVGHSAGCPLILSVLENIKIQIKKLFLWPVTPENYANSMIPYLKN